MALENLKVEKAQDQVLLLKTQQGNLKIPLKHIIYIEGDRNYSYIHLLNGNKELSSKTLGYFKEILSDQGFFRCHRSYLINGTHIKTIEKDFFKLSNNFIIPISRRNMAKAREWCSNSNNFNK